MQVTLQNYHINYFINHITMRQLKINKSITNRSEESLDKYLAFLPCRHFVELSIPRSVRVFGDNILEMEEELR